MSLLADAKPMGIGRGQAAHTHTARQSRRIGDGGRLSGIEEGERQGKQPGKALSSPRGTVEELNATAEALVASTAVTRGRGREGRRCEDSHENRQEGWPEPIRRWAIPRSNLDQPPGGGADTAAGTNEEIRRLSDVPMGGLTAGLWTTDVTTTVAATRTTTLSLVLDGPSRDLRGGPTCTCPRHCTQDPFPFMKFEDGRAPWSPFPYTQAGNASYQVNRNTYAELRTRPDRPWKLRIDGGGGGSTRASGEEGGGGDGECDILPGSGGVGSDLTDTQH